MKPAIILPLALLLAGCTNDTAPSTTTSSEARANAATVAACRERGEALYERQNRDTIYSISSRDTPYSANYTPGVMDRGLPARFGYDRSVRDCIRNTGTQTDRSDTAPATPAPTSPTPAMAPAKP